MLNNTHAMKAKPRLYIEPHYEKDQLGRVGHLWVGVNPLNPDRIWYLGALFMFSSLQEVLEDYCRRIRAAKPTSGIWRPEILSTGRGRVK